MKQAELIYSLENMGWMITKDTVGDKIATFHLTDRISSSIPKIQKLSSGMVIRMRLLGQPKHNQLAPENVFVDFIGI